MSLEKETIKGISEWTEADFNRVVKEYNKRKKSTAKKVSGEKNSDVKEEYEPEPKYRGSGALRVLGRLIIGGIIAFPVLVAVENYKEIERFVVDKYREVIGSPRDFSPISNKGLESNVQTSSNAPVVNYSQPPVQLSSDKYSDTIDMVISRTEVAPGLTIENILGKSMSEFCATTDPDKMVDEITKDTIRALTLKGLQVTDGVIRGVVKGTSDYVENSSDAQRTVQGITDYLNRPETQQAVSQIKDAVSGVGQGINDYMNKPETQQAVSEVKDEVSKMKENLMNLIGKK
jgi:hypothetical protein